MTYARAHLVDMENGGFYHCISRCVRRGWLCGYDDASGRSYEHRRGWIEARLLHLSGIFAVDLFGYAVMSNHYHIVVKVDPRSAASWSDYEVARRWVELHPPGDLERVQTRIDAILELPDRVSVLRGRLGNLSWFMRSMNEAIARRANREDECTGRFWEGRFTSIALLDQAAVLDCMVYVDLNPVRAGIADDVTTSDHTSIRRRVLDVTAHSNSLASLEPLGITVPDYIDAVSWAASTFRDGIESAAMNGVRVPSGPSRTPGAWLKAVSAHRCKYRAYGTRAALEAFARRLGQRSIRCPETQAAAR